MKRMISRQLLPVGVVNYPSEDVPYTRVAEYKRLTGQIHPKTSISYGFFLRGGGSLLSHSNTRKSDPLQAV